MGHDVHVACRTEAKAKAAAEKSGAAGAFACDLSSLESVRSFAEAWGGKPIDTLCLNAGKTEGGATRADQRRICMIYAYILFSVFLARKHLTPPLGDLFFF